ncbi:unnamed protein product [Microthlaspi erraticum]|uniref:Uncharacterized protein n=1 Tax=Microthlaspi erraticum TaxID=1685480 RepID=A0A6D2KZQ9_9BRAS|nr:unnamed protein product [Microthlaspi erraticum]
MNQEEEDQQIEEVCYMSNQGGYYKGYNTNNNTNLSYQSTNVENPQDQVYPPQQNQNQGGQQTVYFKRGYPPKVFGNQNQGSTQAQARSNSSQDSDMKTMLQQLINGQASSDTELNTKLAEINNKVDCSYNDLNKKLESLNSKVQHLEANSHNTPSSSKGMLPGKAIANPKEYVQAITLKSGRVLPVRVVPSRRNEDVAIQEEEEGDSSVNDEKHKKEIKTLNDKLDKILTGQQKQVHFVCEDDVNQEEEDQQTEEVCYMSNQGGYYKGYNTNNNTNLSYRSTNVENPQDQVYPPQQNQNQGGQQTVYFKRGYPPKVFGIRTKAHSSSSREQLKSRSDMKTMLQQLIKGQTSGATELTPS